MHYSLLSGSPIIQHNLPQNPATLKCQIANTDDRGGKCDDLQWTILKCSFYVRLDPDPNDGGGNCDALQQ